MAERPERTEMVARPHRANASNDPAAERSPFAEKRGELGVGEPGLAKHVVQ